MDIHIDSTCIICHQHFRVPVRVTAFNCTCLDGIRCCLTCVRDWFELNKPISQRKTKVKCLFCPKTVTSSLAYTRVYVKDTFLMRCDATPDIECPRDCGFTGTQSQLEEHLRDHCVNGRMACTLCQTWMQRRDLEEHKRDCSGFSKCPHCPEFIPKASMASHYANIHQLFSCRWCQVFFKESDYDAHQRRCPERVLRCEVCQHNFKRKDIKEHVLNEYRAVKVGVDSALARLSKVMEMVNTIDRFD